LGSELGTKKEHGVNADAIHGDRYFEPPKYENESNAKPQNEMESVG
jgi:hypothetical protein